jgi:hypothetical protein
MADNPVILDKRVKIFTNEMIVHSQINAIEKILGRHIGCEITINVRDVASCIQFDATEKEINLIRSESEYNLMIRQGGYWLPLI